MRKVRTLIRTVLAAAASLCALNAQAALLRRIVRRVSPSVFPHIRPAIALPPHPGPCLIRIGR